MVSFKQRLENYDELDKYQSAQLLVDVNNDMYEYAGFLDTDRIEVRNFVLDCLNNTIGIAYCEQRSSAKAQTRDDLINFYE